MDALEGATWFKSSRSGGSGSNCVEVAVTTDVVGVRDTKDRGRGPVLRFSPAQWASFAAALKAGDFD